MFALTRVSRIGASVKLFILFYFILFYFILFYNGNHEAYRVSLKISITTSVIMLWKKAEISKTSKIANGT